MKKTTALFFTLACLGMFQAAQAQPVITVQPLNRTNNVGDNAQFSVTASGTGTLLYQWKFNGSDIPGATTNVCNVQVTNSTQAGTYSVVVTDDNGPTPSSGAALSLPFASRAKITQWNFNSPAPDNNANTGTANPSTGSGTITKLGSTAYTSNGYTTGSPSDPAASDNSRRALTGLQNGSVGNLTGGNRFSVSTAGYTNIAISGELQVSAVGCAYWRGQYTINGTDWVDHLQIDRRAAFTNGYNNMVWFSDDLSGVEGVENNPSFAYRILGEYESTATGSGNDAYVACDPNQAYNNANGLFGWDMITFMGTIILSQPAVTTQPQSQSSYVGANVVLSVTATGGSLQYQWRRVISGVPTDIPNATNSTLAFPNVQLSNAGTYSVHISNSAGSTNSDDAILTVLTEAPPPGDRYWSSNSVGLGGAGTWNTSGLNWGTDTNGPFTLTWNNAGLDTNYFYAPAGTVTIGEPITVNKFMVVGNANYLFSGTNRITFTNQAEFDCTGVNNNAGVTFDCALSAATLKKTGAGRMHLGNAGNTVDKFVVTGGVLSVDNGNRLGADPVDVVPDRITLDGTGIGFEGTTPSLSAKRGLTLGPGGGKLALKPSANGRLTVDAPITGAGGISFPAYGGFHGSGLYGADVDFVFNNQSNNYAGATTVSVGELRLGTNGVLPDTTTLNLNGSSGRLNLNRYQETVGNVIANGSGAAIYDTVGGGSLTATNYDIRTTRTSGGTNLLNCLSAVLAGAANLTKTTSGDAELSGANTYTGDTFLEAGNLILTSPGRFGNGAGTLYLNGGAITLNDTRTESTILLNPVMMTNAVEFSLQSSGSSTGAVVCLSGGAWTAQQGKLWLANLSTDPAGTFTLALTNVAQVGALVTIESWNSGCQLASLNLAGTTQTFECAINGPGSFRRSTLSGPGGTTVLSGANTYSGGTLIEAGTLLANCPAGSSTGSGAVTVSAPGGVLGGNGYVGGPVTVSSGGSIAAGSSAGVLTLQAGLDMSSGGTNVWQLVALKDNGTGAAGTDFDQIVLTGGELVLGGSSSLLLQFPEGLAPSSAIPFWQSAHSWTVVTLSGGQNTANTAFAVVANGSYNAGTFVTSVNGGNIVLTFTPAAPSEPQVTSNPQSRTNVVGTTATFTVAATGSDPLTYKWYRNGLPPTQVPGQTTATCTLLNVQTSQAGDYFAVIQNGLGSTTSQAATLTVVPPPKVASPTLDGSGGVVLTWPTIPQTAYQVLYNTNLLTSNWYPFTNILATGWTISVTDHPPAGGKQRFYRLQIQ